MDSFFLNRTAKIVAVFIALIFLGPLQGCMFYYKVQTVNKVTSEEIKTYDSLKKYIIVHQGDSAWHLDKIAIKENSFAGEVAVLPYYRHKFDTTDPRGGNRYHNTKNNSERYVLEEVHLYLKDSIVPKMRAGDYISLDVSTVRKSEVYTKANGRTAASWAIPAVTPLLVIGGIITIVVTTKSSCPLVYTKKDNSFDFAGEIFGGAVFSSLERHDYLPLPGFKPLKNKYQLIISNGLPEIQYINLAELWIVNHPKNMSVLPDRQGAVHSFSKPEAPAKAVSLANSDILPLINKKDKQYFRFDETPSMTGDTNAFNTAFLTFTVPAGIHNGKLIISAGNSMWGDYTYGEFTKFFGSKYGEWIKEQGKEPAEKNIHWKEQQRFTLMVYVETSGGWHFVDYFDLIGPLGARDLIMPVDFSQAIVSVSAESNRTIRVKLESGFKLWDLDYAAMDFSKDTLFTVDRVKPSSAQTESGTDVIHSLSIDDTTYYVQQCIGEKGLVIFNDSPGLNEIKKSVFLHSKGYYEHVRHYPGLPDYKQLLSFLVPGKFSRFSYENHMKFMKNNWAFAPETKLP